MKGVSKFITYTFLILLGFVMLTLFTTTIYNYYNNILRRNIDVGMKQIAVQTSTEIIKLYDVGKSSNTRPTNASLTVISEIDLNYPIRISQKNYEVRLVSSPGIWTQIKSFKIDNSTATIKDEKISGSRIVVKTTQSPIVAYDFQISNIPVPVQGIFRSGENSTLKYIRYNYNGTVNDTIVLGESNLIIGVVKIQ